LNGTTTETTDRVLLANAVGKREATIDPEVVGAAEDPAGDYDDEEFEDDYEDDFESDEQQSDGGSSSSEGEDTGNATEHSSVARQPPGTQPIQTSENIHNPEMVEVSLSSAHGGGLFTSATRY
jgi:hypothetical protein